MDCQTSRSAVSELTRMPPGPLGEVPTSLINACSVAPPGNGRKVSTVFGICCISAKSSEIWVSPLALHGHSLGGGVRETVITRQPSSRDRWAVACPMPRLAPVTMAVFVSRHGVCCPQISASAIRHLLEHQPLQQLNCFSGLAITLNLMICVPSEQKLMMSTPLILMPSISVSNSRTADLSPCHSFV